LRGFFAERRGEVASKDLVHSLTYLGSMHWRYRRRKIAPMFVIARIETHGSDHDGWCAVDIRAAGVAVATSDTAGIGNATFVATATDIASDVAARYCAIKGRIRQHDVHPVHVHVRLYGIGRLVLKRLICDRVILFGVRLICWRIGERHDFDCLVFVRVFTKKL